MIAPDLLSSQSFMTMSFTAPLKAGFLMRLIRTLGSCTHGAAWLVSGPTAKYDGTCRATELRASHSIYLREPGHVLCEIATDPFLTCADPWPLQTTPRRLIFAEGFPSAISRMAAWLWDVSTRTRCCWLEQATNSSPLALTALTTTGLSP